MVMGTCEMGTVGAPAMANAAQPTNPVNAHDNSARPRRLRIDCGVA